MDDVAIDVSDNNTKLQGDPKNGGYQQAFMETFFEDVEVVKSNIVDIKNSTKKIMEISQNVLQATTNEREADFSNELEPLIKSTNKKAAASKKLLQEMREATDNVKEEKEKQSPEHRIRANLGMTLTRKFVEVMKEYQAAQMKYKTDIKKKAKRQVQIVKPDATTEEIDAVFKSGGGVGDFVKNTILVGKASDAVQNAYIHVADKYKDVLALEASVAELHQMFMDFALLTEQQGELLDQIEFQVKEASDYIDQGNTEMVEAIEIQKSIRYKQVCICMTILLVVGIIVAIVAAKLSGAF